MRSPAPTIKLPTYILYTSLSGSTSADETAKNASSSVTATIVSIDTTKQIIKLKNHSGTFTEGETINFRVVQASLVASKLQQATGTVSMAPIVTTDGAFLNEDDGFQKTQ